MSFEAIAFARPKGSSRERQEKWLTVPTDDHGEAHKAFAAAGWEATAEANRRWP